MTRVERAASMTSSDCRGFSPRCLYKVSVDRGAGDSEHLANVAGATAPSNEPKGDWAA
jgi:hypothetical protein